MSNPRRPLVVIESPFAGDLQANAEYLHECIIDSLKLGEAPFAMHGFYPQHLDDSLPEQRTLGMECGFAWTAAANIVAVYYDRGISDGMIKGILFAAKHGLKLEFRSIRGFPNHV